MKEKTKVIAEENKQEIVITRIFEISKVLLYKAYTEPELIEQWMGNKVIQWDHRDHGCYQYETRDDEGIVVFRANGTIHKVIDDESITRTFEMEGMGFPPQLEFLEFESIDENSSRLTMKIIFKSTEDRDNLLKFPFARGINMAHNELESILRRENHE